MKNTHPDIEHENNERHSTYGYILVYSVIPGYDSIILRDFPGKM